MCRAGRSGNCKAFSVEIRNKSQSTLLMICILPKVGGGREMARVETKIARGETIESWRAVREVLIDNSTQEQLEDLFVRFFVGRLESRYIEPIQQLNRSSSNDGAGFAVVTLYCSIVEFLASTRSGQNYVHLSRDTDRKIKSDEYCDSQTLFVDFLRKQAPFAAVFKTKKNAKSFYTEVRCGLVHEARTKGEWRIRSNTDSGMAIDVSKKLIYKRRLPELFSEYVELYKKEFLQSKTLQANLLRKFDHLCELD